MTRKILDNTRIHPAIASEIGGNADYRHTVDEVEKAIDAHAIVIVGMNHNPFPKKARALLDAEGIAYHYMEYGNYFSDASRALVWLRQQRCRRQIPGSSHTA